MDEHIKRIARGIFDRNKENALGTCRGLGRPESSWYSFMVCYDSWEENGITYTCEFQRLDNQSDSWSIVITKTESLGRFML